MVPNFNLNYLSSMFLDIAGFGTTTMICSEVNMKRRCLLLLFTSELFAILDDHNDQIASIEDQLLHRADQKKNSLCGRTESLLIKTFGACSNAPGRGVSSPGPEHLNTPGPGH